MDLNDVVAVVDDDGKKKAKKPFEIDLNETPLASPRPDLNVSLITNHVPFTRGGQLDINVSPPIEEDSSSTATAAGGGDILSINARNSTKDPVPRTVSHVGAQFDFLKASGTLLPKSNFAGVTENRLFGRNLNETGPPWATDSPLHRMSIQNLYSTPDGGNRFGSMIDAARQVGNINSLEQKGSRTNQKRKEPLTYSRSKNSRECQKNLNRNLGIGFLSSADTAALQACKSTSLKFAPANSKEIDVLLMAQYEEGFPVQFEDLSVLSTGKVDLRPSYHSFNQIWPVGYKSSWHDRITGSLFVCEISDGGDSGPTFSVKRYPCSKQTIPIGSTVLSRTKTGHIDVKANTFGSDVKGDTFGTNDDEDTDFLLILEDHVPPHLEYDTLSGPQHNLDEDCSHQTMNWLPKDSANKMQLADDIGEFFAEERSPSLVWRKVAQTLAHTCREVHKRTGVCRFYCNHDPYGIVSPSSVFQNTEESKNLDSLSKFYYRSCPASIPSCTRTDNELDACCEALLKWLDQDRFGLDVDFVQEMTEKLPGVDNFADYLPLNKRRDKSTLQTVGSGFFQSKRKHDLLSEREVDNSCKRPRKQGLDNSLMKDCPPGKPLSTKLPKDLIGHVLQAWELLWRFSEVLELEEPLSFHELEEELLSGYQQYFIGEKGCLKEAANINTSDSSQTGPGIALTKIYCVLLKVLLGELQFEVAVSGSPSKSDSKRRRKKESDSLISAKRSMLDFLPINELTWPELTRRYISTVLSSTEGNPDPVESASRGAFKVLHCMQGDSASSSCDPLPVVANMEAEALLLAEATNQIFGSKKNVNDVASIDCNDTDALGVSKTTKVEDEEIPEWARVLEPVRKLPTNVGARIRRCVNEALEKDPPEWAKTALEHSICKEVYKGNASGPTKKAVLAVLAEVCGENRGSEIQKQKPAKKKKVKGLNKISDVIMKRCRKVLRCAAVEDDGKVFCNLLGRTLVNSCDNDHKGLIGFPAMVSRPLDFRTIDLRLAFGAYNGSHEAFLEDVQEVWHHIRTAYSDQSEKKIELAERLSQNFELLYEKEVLSLVEKLSPYNNVETLSPQAQKELEDTFECESKLPKAPWDDGVCKVCGVDRDDGFVLLCDTCDSEYHTYCLNPPLASIPDGNWYCPYCVAGRNNQVLPSPKVNRKRRSQGEFTNRFLETLTRLASTMETKEYWEYSIEEKIFLLKFLCDEVLNSTTVREHLELCDTRSIELQQKLQSLSSELKLLKSKECTLDVPNGHTSLKTNESSESTSRISVQHTSEMHSTSNGDQTTKLFGSSVQVNQRPELEKSSYNVSSQVMSGVPENSVSSGISAQQMPKHVKCENLLSGDNEPQTCDHEAINLKKEILIKQDSIADLKSKLSKVYSRKDFLGKDSAERLYWVFAGPGNSPWIVVDGATMTDHMTMVKDFDDSSEKDNFFSSAVWNATYRQYQWRQNNDNSSDSQWFSYQSDAQIVDLVGWLRNGDQKEKELSESIVLLQGTRSKSTEAEDFVQDGSQSTSLEPKSNERTSNPYALVTKAMSMLTKMSHNTEVHRCECLEPMWPARNHCILCHTSFYTMDELKEHNVVCNSASQKKGKDDPQKGKGKSKTQIGRETGSGFGRVKDLACPFDFEEIKLKFVTNNSLKEVIQEIGLFSTNGIPTFLPVTPPSDPALMLQSMNKGDMPRNVENNLAKPTYESKEIFGLRRKNTKQGFGSCYIINEASLRPVVGRSTRILEQLKINLLDMEAIFPGDALKPSKANMEKRCAWRTFVKSAKSIFEMVQAVIVFENIIRTECLKTEWWYWSSPSATAKIASLSSLALRICSLDAAVLYDYEKLTSLSSEIPDNSNKIELVVEDPKKAETDAHEGSKKKSKSSKKRKNTAS
ncbi:hypothetical protein ACFE04_024066 [Oxalis oulophora]